MATADELLIETADAYQDAKTIAENALNATDNALNAASDAVGGLGLDWAVTPVPIPVVEVSDTRVAVPSYIPNSDFSNDVKLAFDERFAQLSADIQPQIENFLETFFPDINQAVIDNSDSWIVNTILNGEYVPVAVENALWNRARDRETQEALRNEVSTIESAGVRGFTIPSGLTNYAIQENQQDLSRRMFTINREIALKAYEVMDANTKFAIQMAVGLRTAFVNAMGDFIRIAQTQANGATDYARLILQAKTGLHDAAINLYRSKLDEEKLRTTVDFGNSDSYVKYADVFISGRSKLTNAEIDIAKVKASTAIEAADTLAKVAASAYATRNSMVSISAGV
jgi:hypothetical protein